MPRDTHFAGHARIGIDVGGTFTDGCLLEEETGEVRVDKVPSTPDDPSVGIEDTDDLIGDLQNALDNYDR